MHKYNHKAILSTSNNSALLDDFSRGMFQPSDRHPHKGNAKYRKHLEINVVHIFQGGS